MKNRYVLDTSTIIDNPNCLDSLNNADIIIHTKVLYELDKLKKYPNETGKGARVFIKKLDTLTKDAISLDNIPLRNNSVLKVISKEYNTIEFGDTTYIDNHILACAQDLNSDGLAVLVSNDINLRLRARSCGVRATSLSSEKVKLDDLYNGIQYILDPELGEMLKEHKFLQCFEHPILQDTNPNEAIIFEDLNGKIISLGRRVEDEVRIVTNTKAWNIKSKNIEQAFALDLLLDKSVPLVSLIGLAGSGKSLISIAAGLEMVIGQRKHNKLIIFRPIQPVGQDLGYLPGSLEEKLDPWFGAIKDSFDILSPGKKKDWKSGFAQYQDMISFEPLTYLRGRSINNAFIILDEAQNISASEIKTALTRVGNNTKIVLTGDIEQIDGKNLDAFNNGLTSVIEAFKESPLAGHLTLTHCERSELAGEAAKLL